MHTLGHALHRVVRCGQNYMNSDPRPSCSFGCLTVSLSLAAPPPPPQIESTPLLVPVHITHEISPSSQTG